MQKLTQQQAAFVVEYVANGANASQAARAAGFSENSIHQAAYKLLNKSHVQAAIRAEQHRLIDGPLCTLALGVLKSILLDEDAPTGARVDAAKTVLDRGGIAARKTGEDSLHKALSEMTLDELNEFIASQEAELKRLSDKAADEAALEGEAERVE